MKYSIVMNLTSFDIHVDASKTFMENVILNFSFNYFLL